MEITGKIIAALEPKSGVSAKTGNAWMTQQFVVETHEQYPKRCVFEVFGEEKLQQANISIGDEVTVSIEINASEYQGKWYNKISAWKVENHTKANQQPQQPQYSAPTQPTYQQPTQQAPQFAPPKTDDLPF